MSQQPRQHNNPNFNSQNNREFRPRNNLSNVMCHYCSKFGHLQKDCRLRQSHQMNNQSNNRPNSNNNQGRGNPRYQNNNNYNRNNNNANNNQQNYRRNNNNQQNYNQNLPQNNQNRQQQQSNNNNQLKCNYCNLFGHGINRCQLFAQRFANPENNSQLSTQTSASGSQPRQVHSLNIDGVM